MLGMVYNLYVFSRLARCTAGPRCALSWLCYSNDLCGLVHSVVFWSCKFRTRTCVNMGLPPLFVALNHYFTSYFYLGCSVG